MFPDDPALLADLPGIGRSTAAAIAAFAYGRRAAILDGNVKRVFARVFGVDGYPGAKPVEDRLWQRAEALLPASDIDAYTQGLMDLGATLCTRSKPSCSTCPLAGRCVALATDRVHELPVSKPRKAIPEKSTAMLVVVDRRQVLLERRPGSGIWGGLLSLPEVSCPDCVDVFDAEITQVLKPFGAPSGREPLLPFTHGFTHFKLHVQPYRIALARRFEHAGQDTHVWLDVEKLADAPLPAPVKKLLLAIFGEADLFACAGSERL